MRLFFKKSSGINSRVILQRCGYHYVGEYKGEPNYANRLSRSQYPQFHVYVNKDTEEDLVLNLHLDLKRPSYRGSKAHSGEYDTELVEREAKRLSEIISSLLS